MIITVYLDPEYKTNDTIEVPKGITYAELLAAINAKFKTWYYFDYEQ